MDGARQTVMTMEKIRYARMGVRVKGMATTANLTGIGPINAKS